MPPQNPIIACARCGGVHPTGAQCKPWSGNGENADSNHE